MAVKEAEDVPPSSPTTSFTAGKDFEEVEIEPFVFEDVLKPLPGDVGSLIDTTLHSSDPQSPDIDNLHSANGFTLFAPPVSAPPIFPHGDCSGGQGSVQLNGAPLLDTPASTSSPSTSASTIPPASTSPPPSKSVLSGATGGSAEGRKISCEDIQLVQNLIERCLQLYMNQRDVISTLQFQAKIEPGFTSLVWQKLEEQNPDFFRAYYSRLKVKEQMLSFNSLLDDHLHLLHTLCRTTPTPPPPTPLPGPRRACVEAAVHGPPMGYPMHPSQGMPHPPMGRMLPHGSMVPGHAIAPPPYMLARPDMVALGLPHPLPQDGSNGGDAHMSGEEGGPSGEGGDAFPFGHADLGLGSFPSSMMLEGGSGGLTTSASRESLGSLGALPRNFSLSDLASDEFHGLPGEGPTNPPPTPPYEDEGFLCNSPQREENDKHASHLFAS